MIAAMVADLHLASPEKLMQVEQFRGSLLRCRVFPALTERGIFAQEIGSNFNSFLMGSLSGQV